MLTSTDSDPSVRGMRSLVDGLYSPILTLRHPGSLAGGTASLRTSRHTSPGCHTSKPCTPPRGGPSTWVRMVSPHTRWTYADRSAAACVVCHVSDTSAQSLAASRCTDAPSRMPFLNSTLPAGRSVSRSALSTIQWLDTVLTQII